MSDDQPKHSPLYEAHVSAGATMAVEEGWEMPARYGDARAEAAAARSSAALADVTHWGRIRIRGDGSGGLLARLCGPEVQAQEDDTVRPCVLRKADGAAVAARLLRLEDYWLVLTSPKDRLAVLELLFATAQSCEAASGGSSGGSNGGSVRVDDQTGKTAMLAVLGPRAPACLDAFLPIKVGGIADGSAKSGSVVVAKYVALRSDLGDLWRMEVVLPNMLAAAAWRFITQKAGDNALVPIGTEAMEMLGGEG